jgi:hypothetical protein
MYDYDTYETRAGSIRLSGGGENRALVIVTAAAKAAIDAPGRVSVSEQAEEERAGLIARHPR